MSEPKLHLDDGSGWKPYYATSYAVPDREHMSRGMATFCKLLAEGWISEKSADLVAIENEGILESLSRSLQEAKAGERIPNSKMWEGVSDV